MRKISFIITDHNDNLDDNLKTSSDLFFIADFNLLAVNLIALHLNCCIVSFYIDKNQVTLQ